MLNTATFERFRVRAMLNNLQEACRSPGQDDPFGEIDTRAMAQAGLRSMTGSSALACLMAQPSDHARTIPAGECMTMAPNGTEVLWHRVVRRPCVPMLPGKGIRHAPRAHVPRVWLAG